MIHVNPSLFLRRLVVKSYSGGVAYDETFHVGVNIIRGQNSSGKSTIANFIFYVLGGDFNNWTTEAAKCQEVFAEVSINETIITLKRVISPHLHQPMSIYWGSYSDSLMDLASWRTFSYRQSEQVASFSRILFEALDFPQVKFGDTDAIITMHQILRLLYIDQDTPTQSLFRAEKFDPPLVRQTVSEILLGIYEDSLYNDRVTFRRKEKDFQEKNSQYEGMKRIYSQAGEQISVSAIKSEIEKNEESLIALEQEVTTTRAKRNVSLTKRTVLSYQKIQGELSALKSQIAQTSQSLQTVEIDIFDSVQFINTLENRIKELDYSMLTRKYLGELPLTHCPHCLSALTESADGHCILCKQPLSEGEERSGAKKLQLEMQMQVGESKSLLEHKEKRAMELRASLPALQEKATVLQKQLDKAIDNSQSTRDDRIDTLLVQKGSIEQKINYLLDQIKSAELMAQLREELADMAREIRKLRLLITEKEGNQESKTSAAYSAIRKYTVDLLKRDLPRQPEFRVGNEVEIDFKKDSFALDGSNNFSASSKIYFKNSILYSIFFSSLTLDFFRYPRFILCDNMEDKGMEKERSQNFQNLIVSLSNAHKVEHQIIFTTAMIADELNNTALCVGQYYSDADRTLKIAD